MTDQLLVSTQWLHDHLDDPNLRIVDIRGHVIAASEPPPHYFNHYDDYLQSHIPGAVFVDWVHEITDPNDPRHAQIARPDRYEAFARRIGIDADTLVVAYDDADSMFAARLWWSLNYYGHRHVAVLDGGWLKWTAEGRPTSDTIPHIEPSHFEAQPNENLRRTADQILAGLQTDERVLLDVRSSAEFAGQAARASRMGHIPGAVNQPRPTLVQPDHTMPPPDQLRQIFAQHGINADTAEVVPYCNGGVSASYAMLALRVAGFEDVAMYDGSWKEWGNDDSKPIES
ncbi:MAG: sulfurtransferase [Anaerolineaceae bacterium]|nr:sulfurtransferase [Anaerolineaceae bacterium]